MRSLTNLRGVGQMSQARLENCDARNREPLLHLATQVLRNLWIQEMFILGAIARG